MTGLKNSPRYKIIFSGPPGAGKASAIASLSDITPIKKQITSSPPSAEKNEKLKGNILDYGLINVSDDIQIHLYGSPEQKRFSFMWDMLTHRGLGLILLIDNTDTSSLNQLKHFLKAFQGFISANNLAIGITKMDLAPLPTIRDYQVSLRGTGLTPPIFEVDARSQRDVSLLMQALLQSIDPTL